MVPRVLTPYDEKVVERMWIAVLQSPQGRDVGRYFLVERGKGEEGNFGQLQKEMFDILARCIRQLYKQPIPVMTNPVP